MRYNYWGNAINVEDFLYPADHYGFDPVWSFGGGSPITQTPAELLYTTATNQVSDSAFLPAKNTFKQVTTTYPESNFASTSMRELLYLELLAGNDFHSLKNWYLTNPVILQNESLTKLGDNLANKCDETYSFRLIQSDDFKFLSLKQQRRQKTTANNTRSYCIPQLVVNSTFR